jgi:hypothetical protein
MTTPHERAYLLKVTVWTGEAIVDIDGMIVPAVRVWKSGTLTLEELKQEWVDCEDAAPPTATKMEKTVYQVLTEDEVSDLLVFPTTIVTSPDINDTVVMDALPVDLNDDDPFNWQ